MSTPEIPCPHPFYRATEHAAQRAREMNVDWVEVLQTCVEPDHTYPSPKTYGVGRRIAVGGRLAVVYDQISGAVITVLWRGAEGREAV